MTPPPVPRADMTARQAWLFYGLSVGGVAPLAVAALTSGPRVGWLLLSLTLWGAGFVLWEGSPSEGDEGGAEAAGAVAAPVADESAAVEALQDPPGLA